jgi:hypothetical protein
MRSDIGFTLVFVVKEQEDFQKCQNLFSDLKFVEGGMSFKDCRTKL